MATGSKGQTVISQRSLVSVMFPGWHSKGLTLWFMRRHRKRQGVTWGAEAGRRKEGALGVPESIVGEDDVLVVV